jgi:hypothetical protein
VNVLAVTSNVPHSYQREDVIPQKAGIHLLCMPMAAKTGNQNGFPLSRE